MLSKRLSAIAKLVNINSIVADIGSDHGLLPCFLVLNEISEKAYAVDNKKGPLKRAKENVYKYGLNDKVFPILSNGLNELENDVNSIVIAGMGFMTVKEIIETNSDKLENINQLIIQSNTDVNLLRKWIMDKKYLIDDEIIVYDNNKYYFIFNINPSISKEYPENQWLVSDNLIENKDQLYYDYLKFTLNKLKDIIKFKSDRELSLEIEEIENILKRK